MTCDSLVAMEAKTLNDRQADAKQVLCVGRFYWIKARFPKELDLSKNDYTRSPLRSCRTPLPSIRLSFGRKLLRVSTDTSIWQTQIDGGKMRGKRKLSKRRLCYLAWYDKVTNEGVIFLGTTTEPNNAHRFAIVQSRSPRYQLEPGSLGTMPPYSFGKEETGTKVYLNFSHPLRVKFAYFSDERFRQCKIDEMPCDGEESPPLVAIAKFATQRLVDKRVESFFGLDKESEQLFWEKHQDYHMSRLGPLQLEDDSEGAGPNDGG